MQLLELDQAGSAASAELMTQRVTPTSQPLQKS
jgi:hypothetical protein